MKKILSGLLLTVLLLNVATPTVLANTSDYVEVEKGVYWINSKGTANNMGKISGRSMVESNEGEKFEKKSPEERAALPKEEQEIIASIEQYINGQVNLKGRSIAGDTIEDAMVSLAFDFGFKRNNLLFDMIAGLNGSNEAVDSDEYTAWYNSLTNTSERTLTVFDEPTGKNLRLYSRYIDNGSSKTVILHTGYRAPQNGMMRAAKFFSDNGYNVLQPDTRSHNGSEGEYITFGYYEKNDLNQWIDQEVAQKPGQEVVLYGNSMGAATTMMSQATPHPNVKAYIEDCGYSSLEQQLRDTLHLLTKYFEYIPIVNLTDWYAKEGALIQKLNEQKIKPVLKFDLYEVSPFEAVKTSGVPKLFIHGEADWFIPPVALNLLYANAIGYKEQLIVPNAGHAEAFGVGGDVYTQKVLSFLESVYSMKSKMPVVAPDTNLLNNTSFDFTNTNFNGWETSTTFENTGFTNKPLARNSYGEFVFKNSGKKDVVTAAKYNDGIRFYARYGYNDGLVGQNVPVVAGETYELSFNGKNETAAAFTRGNILYGIDSIKKDEGLSNNSNNVKKTLLYTADETKEAKVKVGGKLGYYAWYDLTDYAHISVNKLNFVNTDRTPPQGLIIHSISTNNGICTVQGTGERNSKVLLENQLGEQKAIVETDNKGNFSLSLSKDLGTTLHLINMDTKGNKSQSNVFVFQ